MRVENGSTLCKKLTAVNDPTTNRNVLRSKIECSNGSRNERYKYFLSYSSILHLLQLLV